jgi:nucleoid-associated protein YgaU
MKRSSVSQSELENQKNKLQADLQNVMEKLAEKEGQLQSLRENIYTKDKEFQEFGDNTSIQIEGLSSKLQNLLLELDEKERRTVQLIQDIKISDQKNRELQSELLYTRQALQKKEGESTSLIRDLHASMDLLKKDLFEERNKYQSLASLFEKARQDYSAMDDQKINLEVELEKTVSMLEDLENELSREKSNHFQKNREFQILENAYNRMYADFSDEVDQLKKISGDKEDEIRKIENSLNNLLIAKDNAHYQIATLQHQLNQSNGILGDLQSQLQLANETIALKQDEMENLTISQANLQRELSDQNDLLRKQLLEELAKVDSLKTHLTSLLPRYEEEKEKNNQIQVQFEKLNAQLAEAKSALGYTEQQNQMSKDRFNTIVKENQKLMQERDALVNQSQNDREELATQKEIVRRLTESLNNQKSALNKIEKSHLNLVSELENARTQHNLILRDLPRETSQFREQLAPRNLPAVNSKAAQYGYRNVHIVADGENLNNISMKYYGTPYRWSDIFEANGDVISDVNKIKVGTALVIPE